MQHAASVMVARRFERTAVNANALLYCRGRSQTVKIVDYSQGGLQLAGTFGLFQRDQVQVELMSGVRLPGRVAWSLGRQTGIAFREPLPEFHPAILELAQKAGRTLRTLSLPIANARRRHQPKKALERLWP